MTHVSPSDNQATPSGAAAPVFSMSKVFDMFFKHRAERDARKAIARLSRYSDRQLADIGLKQSDLMPTAFEKAADARAKAMLRVFF